jgi:hypothetical protein
MYLRRTSNVEFLYCSLCRIQIEDMAGDDVNHIIKLAGRWTECVRRGQEGPSKIKAKTKSKTSPSKSTLLLTMTIININHDDDDTAIDTTSTASSSLPKDDENHP